jgi:2-polyprenyl-3-methyl-5-hydroxy-6-metoxy-1,4-benzoquinol methylase
MEPENKSNSNSNFHSLSFRDPNGRVLKLDGQIYRAITSNQASFYKELFEKGIVQKLIERKLLVDTQISSLKIDGYELTLKHRTIPFVSFAHEWCDVMLKDAALLHIELLIELNEYALTSQDGVHLNILFDGSQPVFVDFCSIVLADRKSYWPGIAYERFRNNFIFPVSIMSLGYRHLARSWIKNTYYIDANIIRAEMELFSRQIPAIAKVSRNNKVLNLAKLFIPTGIKPRAKQAFNSIKSKFVATDVSSRLNFLQVLKQEVESLNLPSLKIDQFRCYDNFFSSFNPTSEWTRKQESIYKVLSTLRPNSVLDVDSNQGWYAQLAARCGSQVVAFDTEEACVRKLYADAQENNLYILPLVMDWTSANFNLSNDFFAPITERFAGDMVLGLNFVHHVVFNPYIGLERLWKRLSSLSKRWVLVEFIPQEEILNLIPPNYVGTRQFWEKSPWYSLDEFMSLFQTKFHKIEILSSYPETRKLILCEKMLASEKS